MTTAQFIIQVSKGLIRNQRARRVLMFYSVLIALVLLFAGATFFDASLRAHPLLFLAYWAVCAWITLLAVLLALFDMLVVRGGVRRERRRLEQEYLEKHPDDPQPR